GRSCFGALKFTVLIADKHEDRHTSWILMRSLIALFACSLAMAPASASDSAPQPADGKTATVRAILEGKPVPGAAKPDMKALAAAADARSAAAARAASAPAADDEQAEVDL